MFLIRNFFRRSICTKPAKRSKAKIGIPLPKSAGEPIKLENGCTFIQLKPKTIKFETLPPLVPSKVGRYVGEDAVEEMTRLRAEAPEKWTLTQLSKRFQVSRLFVINNVFSKEEREKYKQEIDDMIRSMTLKEQKGWILRHKIRQDREESWP